MEGLVALIVWIIVVGLILMLGIWVIRTLGIPEPFAKIATVLIVVIGVLLLLMQAMPLLGVSL